MSCGMKTLTASFGRHRRRSVRKHRKSSSSSKHAKCLSVHTRMSRRHRRHHRRSSKRSSNKRSSKRSSNKRSSFYKMLMPWRSSGRRYRFGGAGDGGMGPGYAGPTSFQNGYASYFGGQEPFINASEFWYPNPSANASNLVPSNQPTNYQSFPKLSSYGKFGRHIKCGNKCKCNKCRKSWFPSFPSFKRRLWKKA